MSQSLRQRQLLAHWRDRAWTYHSSESHADASVFRERMRAYGKPELEPQPVANAEITTLARRKK